MKSNYFSSGSKTSQIKVKREKPRKKQVNWDRTVYLLVLILALTMITRYFLTRTYFVSGEGQVISEVVDIRSPDDVDIRMIRVRPGDFVEPGDTLFSFSFIDWQERQAEIDRVNQRIADLRFELADANEKSFLKREEIRSLENRILYLSREKEAFQERVRLNISTVFELNAINRDLFDAESNLELAISEARVLKNLIERMEERLDLFLENYYKIAQNVETRFFTSQLGGRIDNVYKKGNSQAFRSEEILTLIPDHSEVFVLSVFNRKDTRYLTSGSIMNIEFDNGDRSHGVITQTYEARDDLLRHFRQTGTITSDYLIVELEPSDENTRDFWRAKNRSGLQISKPRYFNLRETIASGFGTAIANRVDERNPVPLDSDLLQNEIVNQQKSESVRDKTNCNPNLSGIDDLYESNIISRELSPEADEEIIFPEVTDLEAEESRAIDGFSINLYTFGDPERAGNEAIRIQTGLSRFVCEMENGEGRQLWRVSTGQFSTFDKARIKAEELFADQGKEFFISLLAEESCNRYE